MSTDLTWLMKRNLRDIADYSEDGRLWLNTDGWHRGELNALLRRGLIVRNDGAGQFRLTDRGRTALRLTDAGREAARELRGDGV